MDAFLNGKPLKINYRAYKEKMSACFSILFLASAALAYDLAVLLKFFDGEEDVFFGWWVFMSLDCLSQFSMFAIPGVLDMDLRCQFASESRC